MFWNEIWKIFKIDKTDDVDKKTTTDQGLKISSNFPNLIVRNHEIFTFFMNVKVKNCL